MKILLDPFRKSSNDAYLYEEGFYTQEDLDKLINEDCKGIVDALTDD